MSTAAAAAYRALAMAMLVNDPLCSGDSRFTRDSKADDSELAELCAVCGLRSPCRAYARIERPNGFWGGQRWRRSYTRGGETADE